MKIEKKTITPIMASEYLERNVFNRNLKSIVVDSYARDMRNGKWALNGDTIRFDENGTLIDGQHRLAACIKAGVPFETFVVTGLPHSVFDTIDNGATRTGGDIFKLNEVPSSNNVAATVRRHILLINGYVATIAHGKGMGTSMKVSNRELYDVYKTDQMLYLEATRLALRCYDKSRILSVADIGGYYCYLVKNKHWQPWNVQSFFEQLCDICSTEYNAIRTLRQMLATDKAAPKHMEAKRKQALIIKAWNYYARRENVKLFRLQPQDLGKWFC